MRPYTIQPHRGRLSLARPKGKPGEMRDQVQAMFESGVKPRRIAYALDLSTAQVYDHIAKLREAGKLPREKAEAS